MDDPQQTPRNPTPPGASRAVWWEPGSEDAGARSGVLHTPHGPAPTPAFMPVGTVGTVKGVTVNQLAASGARVVLGNTYHLALRPGPELVADLGGLHTFMGWDGPMLTDSGGFQVFSLGPNVKLSETGVTFRSHIDGALLDLSPERAIEIQELLGADIIMQLDDVAALPSPRQRLREACERSLRWAERCKQARSRTDQGLFGIVQGGLDRDLRTWSAKELIGLDLDGYAIGGLSVGEAPSEMYAMLDHVCPLLPADRPKYLMGVGTPTDLLEGVARGVDMFDCVMPTRNGRNALAFTSTGVVRIRNARHRADNRPLDEECDCPAERHSRGYLRHLFQAGEMLGPILLSLHNLRYYQRLMRDARAAITEGRFSQFRRQTQLRWQASDQS